MSTKMKCGNRNSLSKLLVFVFLLIFVVLLPAAAQTGEELKVTGGTPGTDFTYVDGVLTFLKGGEYKIEMADGVTSTGHQIVIDQESIYGDTKRIELTLSNLTMERGKSYIIRFNNTDSSKIIDAEFVLDGTNKITNTGTDENDTCINVPYNSVITTISGAGSLELKAGWPYSRWNGKEFILDSEDVTLTTTNVGILDDMGIYINAGTMNITSKETGALYTNGVFKMTGGKLTVTHTGDGTGITITGMKSVDGEVGFEVSGGELTLNISDTTNNVKNTGVLFVGYLGSNKKDILISNDAKVTINGGNTRLAGIILYQSVNDFTIDGGNLTIESCTTGILRNAGSVVNFNGGETEITAISRALYHIVYPDALKFGADYKHKDYEGTSVSDRPEVKDSELVNSDGNSTKYVLITPAYDITYDLQGGSFPGGTTVLERYSRVDLPYLLSDPERDGFTFLGWTGSSGDSPVTSLTIPEGTTGDLSYTANWKQNNFSVIVAAGVGMTHTSGPASQIVKNGESITEVIYTADEDYYFPEDYSAEPGSGIIVRRDSASQITVYGTPTADISVILPDATPKTKKEDTPEAVFTATGPDTGILSGLEPGATYTVTGATPEAFTFTVTGTEEKLAGVSAGTLTLVKKGGETTIDSDPQELPVTKAAVPEVTASDCTTADNNDGILSGVTAEMEYRKAGTDEWITGDGSDITGLEPGAYFIHVREKGSMLASEDQELMIMPYTPQEQTAAPVFSPSSGSFDDAQQVTIS